MKEENANVDLSKLRKNILANLVIRHKDKEPDEEYWSMKLLIQLGLIPDPDAKN